MTCSRLLLLYLLRFQNVTDGREIEIDSLKIDLSMAALSSALIEENSIELELAMQDAGRHILAAVNPNIGTVASRAPDTAAEQVCLALHSRFPNRATCRAAQNGCWRAAKRPRRSGVAAPIQTAQRRRSRSTTPRRSKLHGRKRMGSCGRSARPRYVRASCSAGQRWRRTGNGPVLASSRSGCWH